MPPISPPINRYFIQDDWHILVLNVYKYVVGGGAIEMELSKYLRDFSRTIAGKEQLLIGAMAKALEVIPRQLCDNAGFDATNILNKLRQKHAQGEYHNRVLFRSCMKFLM